jgi:hypothetical protein
VEKWRQRLKRRRLHNPRHAEVVSLVIRMHQAEN